MADVSERLLANGHAAYMRSIEPALAEIANAVGLLIEERQAYAAQRIRNMLNQDAQIAQDILNRQVWDKARKNA